MTIPIGTRVRNFAVCRPRRQVMEKGGPRLRSMLGCRGSWRTWPAPDVFTVSHIDLIIALVAQNRLPAVYAFGNLVSAGGLMSYGTDRVDKMRQAASYIDRILRGDKPSDLPVQAPTEFETVLNLRTARALGLTIPPVPLLAANGLIE